MKPAAPPSEISKSASKWIRNDACTLKPKQPPTSAPIPIPPVVDVSGTWTRVITGPCDNGPSVPVGTFQLKPKPAQHPAPTASFADGVLHPSPSASRHDPRP
jgi:hypothetical protein